MKKITEFVVSVCAGGDTDLSKQEQTQIEVDFAAVVGDRHAGPSRTAWSGDPLKPSQWLKPAAGRRGIVGVVDVPGIIQSGDEVIIEVFETPQIRKF